jgi:hypothetical protein
VERCGGARGRARRLRVLGREVGVGLQRVSKVDNDMQCERFTLVMHIESCSKLCYVWTLRIASVLRSRCCVACWWWDARRGMMRGGEDGAVER